MSIVASPHTFSSFKNEANKIIFKEERYLWQKHFQNLEKKFDIVINI